jgi:hypothetical protein
MVDAPHRFVAATVLLLSAYSLLKLAFFALPYARRRAALDKSYAGKAHATRTSDGVLLLIVVALAATLLAGGGEPISFLGGLFIGATLIQLFFHAFHASVPPGREAPDPHSPLKQMSYAIQDRPRRAWKEMAAYALIVVAWIGLYVSR